VGSVCHDIIARRELEEVHAHVPDELPYWPDILRHYPPSKACAKKKRDEEKKFKKICLRDVVTSRRDM
jgi:hypothetical protein